MTFRRPVVNAIFQSLGTDVSQGTNTYADLISNSITTNGGNVVVHFSFSGEKDSGTATAYFKLVVDGVDVNGGGSFLSATSGFAIAFGITYDVTNLSPGPHIIKYQWKTDGGSVRSQGSSNPSVSHVNLYTREE